MAPDEPIALDGRRGPAELVATEIRRRRAEVEAGEETMERRRAEFERMLASAPAANWADAVEKARYLISLLAGTSAGRNPRRQMLIDAVLADFSALLGEAGSDGAPPDGGGAAKPSDPD